MTQPDLQSLWRKLAIVLLILSTNAYLETQGSAISLTSVLKTTSSQQCELRYRTAATASESCDWHRIMALSHARILLPLALLTLGLQLVYVARSRAAPLRRYPVLAELSQSRRDWLTSAYRIGSQVLVVWWPTAAIWHCVRKIMNTSIFFVESKHATHLGGCARYIQPDKVVADDWGSHLFGCFQSADFYKTPFHLSGSIGPSFHPGIEPWLYLVLAVIVSAMAFATLHPVALDRIKRARPPRAAPIKG